MSVDKLIDQIKTWWLERAWFKQNKTLYDIAVEAHNDAVKRGKKKDR